VGVDRVPRGGVRLTSGDQEAHQRTLLRASVEFRTVRVKLGPAMTN
jgi:hypothetical protein